MVDDKTNDDAADSDAPTESGQLNEERRRAATVANAPSERYQLRELLGKGGMGEVIAAHDTVLGREVAIKRMRSNTPSALHISRFLREAQIQGRLDHPAVPPVHEMGHDERGLPYFVMKQLSGMTLGRILDELAAGDPEIAARFPRQRLLRAFVDVCLAIELAHTRGIIHRDIKPANIMLGDFGEVFVIDWGVAKIVDDFDPWTPSSRDRPPTIDATLPGTVIGTPGYMSPEQRNGHEVDASADIYALGCVLFEILTFTRVRTDTTGPLRPSLLEPDVSPELDALCAEATATSATVRTARARTLGESTQRFLDGDRDLALRKRLADDHYRRAARAAVERELHDEMHQLAIREGGRALALDPTHGDAAQLVSWLMLEPPRRLPDALEHELETAAQDERKRQARLGLGAYVALGALVPHMIWSGVREPGTFAAFVVLLVLLIGHAVLGTRTIRFPRVAPILSLGLSTILVAMLARMYSPFVIAPGVAALTGVVFMGSAMFRTRPVLVAAIVLLCLAIVVPYALELAGVLAPTMAITNGKLVLENLALELSPAQTGVGLMGFAIGLVGIATLLSWVIASREAGARRRLQIQAWQLRQLVPEPVAAIGAAYLA